MNNVVTFPTTLDIDPQDVLKAAIEAKPDAVMVLMQDGEHITMYSSLGSTGDILLMLETCKAGLFE